MNAKSIWNDVQKLRVAAPLVHNITNYVVMNNTANALLAIGASPVMAHAAEEVEEMVGIASALVINIGTLSREWIAAMELAMQAAAKKGIPIIFDPVGAGATSYRTRTCLELLQKTAPTIIRGNASEILALLDSNIKTRGVDSSAAGRTADSAAARLAREYGCVVVVSGETDLVTNGATQHYVNNGHALMPRVTGLGCTATALVGAFAAINSDMLAAASHAMAVMGICGELAAETAAGPASLQMNFIDSLFNLNEQQIKQVLR
ncbi:hydroxyethylthiazole kinase [Geopsychrobacter electrodiphilus]|uniref:hydroxyethylthiazole kinase n=1 Tax=Geopsychrobacter electrodiphilus TaxID=225196 RepID=UPI0003714B73|nr:hydroxyethylthiazole kinase [Geopsychrobacter electrodiphilus]